MKKLMLWAIVFVIAILTSLIKLYTPKTAAVSVWTGGATIYEEAFPSGPVNGGNIECDYFTLKSKYLTHYSLQNGRVGYSDTTTESDGVTYPDICMAQNDHGLVGTGYWTKDGNINDAMPIDAGPYNMLPTPGGDVTLIMTPAPTFGTQYSINHNLPYIGYVGVHLIGSGTAQKSEKVWKIDTTKIEQFLAYSDNQIVRIDQVGFSSNGRYMVAQLSRRGLALIDLYTEKLTPFSPNSFTTGANMFMNVSNDGKYIAVYSPAGLTLHDVSGCAASYDHGQWPSTGVLSSSGCVSREYYSDVRAAYPLVSNVNRLRFAPNGGSLNIDVSWRDSSGELIAKRLRLSANGYASAARGYLAMGDSYSSGEGDTEGGTWYEPGTDEQGDITTFAGRNLCHLSRRSYPYLMAVELGFLSNNIASPPADGQFHSVACSGAKIHNIIGAVGEKQDDGDGNDFAISDNQYRFDKDFLMGIWQPGAVKQISTLVEYTFINDQLREKFSPEVITIGIGGNDAGFGDFMAACVTPGTCELAQPSSKKSSDALVRIAQNHNRLVDTYKKVKLSAPDARIYVHGYPKFVEGVGGYCAVNVRLDDQERLYVENVIHYMNEVVSSAAREAGVAYVDVENIFDRQKLCSGVTQDEILMNGVTAGNDVRLPEESAALSAIGLKNGICLRACIGRESYHPKPTGFVKYKEAILAQTNNLTAQMPVAASEPIPVPGAFFGSLAINKIIEMNTQGGFPVKEQVLVEDLITGFQFSTKTISLNLGSLAPNSSFELVIESTPVSLGRFTSNADGVFVTSVSLPDTIGPGHHELHIIGRDTTGRSVDYYRPFILGSSEADFDGDGVLDTQDSCSAIQNSNTDIDVDGVDDACDENPIAPSVPPQAPGTPDLVDASDTGESQTDNITNDASPTFAVSCSDSNIVTIYVASKPLGSAVCFEGTAMVTSLELTGGQHDVVAKQVDQKDTASDASGILSTTIDISSPITPPVPDLNSVSDTGISNSDNRTSDATPTIDGVCYGEDTVNLYIDSLLNTKAACSNGQYSVDLTTLAQGAHSVQSSFSDAAGNMSTLSDALQITIGPDNIEPDDEREDCRKDRSVKKGRSMLECGVPSICELLEGRGSHGQKDKDDNKKGKKLVVADHRPSKQIVVVEARKTIVIKVK